jgi:hypothetical protein
MWDYQCQRQKMSKKSPADGIGWWSALFATAMFLKSTRKSFAHELWTQASVAITSKCVKR